MAADSAADRHLAAVTAVDMPRARVSPGRLLTAEEVADRLAVPTGWVYAEARAGRMPHVRLGRYVRFRPEALDDWVAAAESGPTPARRGPRAGSGPGGSAHG